MITFGDIRRTYKYFKNKLHTSDKDTIFNAMVVEFTSTDQLDPTVPSNVGRLYVRVSLYSLIAWLF